MFENIFMNKNTWIVNLNRQTEDKNIRFLFGFPLVLSLSLSLSHFFFSLSF